MKLLSYLCLLALSLAATSTPLMAQTPTTSQAQTESQKNPNDTKIERQPLKAPVTSRYDCS